MITSKLRYAAEYKQNEIDDFDAADVNHDGVVDRDEWAKFAVKQQRDPEVVGRPNDLPLSLGTPLSYPTGILSAPVSLKLPEVDIQNSPVLKRSRDFLASESPGLTKFRSMERAGMDVMWRESRLAEVFRAFDMDGNCRVDRSELLTLVGAVSNAWSSQIVGRLLDITGSPGKGTLSEADFMSFFGSELPLDPDHFDAAVTQLLEGARHARRVKEPIPAYRPVMTGDIAEGTPWPTVDQESRVQSRQKPATWASFHVWRFVSQSKGASLQSMMIALSFHRALLLRRKWWAQWRLWRLWRVRYGEWVEASETLEKGIHWQVDATRRWTLRAVARTWYKWFSLSVAWYRAEEAVDRLSKRRLDKAFTSWLRQFDSGNSLNDKEKRALNRMHLRNLSVAWETWLAWYDDDCERADLKTDDAVHVVLQLRMSQGFTRWRVAYTELMIDLKICQHAMLQMQGIQLSRCFRQWRAVELPDETRLRSAIGKMQHRAISKAFNSMLADYDAILDLRAIVLKMQHYKLAKAVVSWRACHTEGERQFLQGQGAVRRMQHQSLLMAFEAWQYDTAQIAAQQLLVKGANFRLANAQVTRAFNSWRVVASELKLTTGRASGAVMRMQHRKVSMAFERWQANAAQIATESAAIQYCGIRFLKASQARAFSAWRIHAAELKHTLIVGCGAIRRMKLRKLSLAFEAWQYDTAQIAAQQLLVKGANFRLANAQVTRAFNSWRVVASELKLTTGRASGAVMRMQHRKVSMAFERWQANAAQIATEKSSLKRSAMRFLKASQARAFSAWRVFGGQSKRQRRLGSMSIMCMVRRKLSMAFHHWQSTAAHMVSERKKFLADACHMVNGHVTRAFNQWRSAAKQMSADRYRAGGAVRRMRDRVVSMAFKTWQAQAAQGKYEKQTMIRVLDHLTSSLLARAFIKWRDSTIEVNTFQSMLARAIVRWTSRGVLRALHSWRRTLPEFATDNARLRRALKHMYQAPMSRAFVSWQFVASHSFCHDVAVESGERLWDVTAMAMSLKSWRLQTGTQSLFLCRKICKLKQDNLPRVGDDSDDVAKELFLLQEEIRECDQDITNFKNSEEEGWLSRRQARDARLKLESLEDEAASWPKGEAAHKDLTKRVKQAQLEVDRLNEKAEAYMRMEQDNDTKMRRASHAKSRASERLLALKQRAGNMSNEASHRPLVTSLWAESSNFL